MADDGNDATVSTALARELILKPQQQQQQQPLSGGNDKDTNSNNSNKRCTKEAASAASELLRLFVLEARNRASIEAECETEAKITDENNAGIDKAMIRADHIAKIAAELLMDFT